MPTTATVSGLCHASLKRKRFSSSEFPITETEPVVMAITPIIG